MLGLNQPSYDPPISNRSISREPVSRQSAMRDDRGNSPAPTVVIPTVANPSFEERTLHQPSPTDQTQYQPSMDSLREKAFSGLDSFLEPEEPKTGGRRIFLMILLLAALGGAGWWLYTNYLGTGVNRKTETTASNSSESPADTPAQSETQTQSKPTAAPNAGTSQPAPPSSSSSVPEGPSENAVPTPDATGNTSDESPEKTAAAAKTPAAPTPISKRDARREARLAHPKTPKPLAPEPEDKGDAAFRKGEAYLYGRGAPENCDEAVKNLKAASAKSNAKARIAFGTMYATEHCVPRDLPTSYTWFALALRADPNNQILEKDLTAIWNQMTPPERQLATRMKQ